MKKALFISLFASLVCCQGCTKKAWYDAFRQGQRRECYNGRQTELSDCLRQADYPYQNFEKDRQKDDQGQALS